MSVDWSVLLGEPDVSRETTDRLHQLAALVRKWTPRINLIAPSTVDEIETRHILDSAQLFRHAPRNAKIWLDLGSGAGFPGLVIAILARQYQPDLKVILVESDHRKATFLRTAVRELDLKATVISERAEQIPPQSADVVSARALGSLKNLLELAFRHLAPEGVGLFPKGQRAQEEIDEAFKTWHFNLIPLSSRTDPGATIVKIEGLAHA